MFGFHFTNLRTKIVDKLGLSYRSARELNNMIDTKLSGRPRFQCNVLDIGDEQLEFYCRDVLECIQSLYGDPGWAQDMAFVPERHYTSHARTARIYNELYTSDWWWTVQVCYSSLDKIMY
jgi:Plavaka transposase